MSSSSPARLFSSDPIARSSPPSSPVGFPWELEYASRDESELTQPPPKNAFSVLGKRKSLGAVSENVRSTKRPACAKEMSDKVYTQMQISLGQETLKRCSTCGMEYVISSPEDRKTHDTYHKQINEGYHVGIAFWDEAKQHNVFRNVPGGGCIVAVDFLDRIPWRRKAQAVLDIVQRELGAVEIRKELLWDEPLQSVHPTYRIYMYILDDICVGFLLAEGVTNARQVLEPKNHIEMSTKDVGPRYGSGVLAALQARRQKAAAQMEHRLKQPLQISDVQHEVQLGISRIWTSSKHRKRGLATALLDAAFEHHRGWTEWLGRRNAIAQIRQDEVRMENVRRTGRQFWVNETLKRKYESKDVVAFSQPTEAGTRLARKWFGRDFGWSVYLE